MSFFVFKGVDPERLLPWLAAAAVAVLVIYLIRTTRKRTRVTAAPVWDRVIAKRRVSLRELLSYFAQVLVLALVLGALSDPRDPASEEGLRRALAVVVDASGSMATWEGGGRRIDLAKGAARELLASLADGDPVLVVRAGAWPAPLTAWTTDRVAAMAAVDGIVPDAAAGDMDGALRLASEALARVRPAPGDRRVLAVYSDRVWPGPPPVGRKVDLHQLVLGVATENVGVVDLDLRPARGLERGWDVWVKVHNYGRAAAKLDLAVHSDEVIFGKVPLSVGPGADETRLWHLDYGATARTGVRVTAAATAIRTGPGGEGGDPLTLDDRAVGVLPKVRVIDVVLVTAGNRFLEEALKLNPEVKLVVKGPGAFDGRVAAGTLVVFDKVTPEPTALPARAILVDPAEGRSPFKVKKRVPRPRITDWVGDHPLLKGATVRDLFIEEGSLFATDRADVALVSADGSAIVAAREAAGRRLLAIGFDVARSDLPLRVAFPVFLRNALRWFGEWEDDDPAGPMPADLAVGRAVRVGEPWDEVAIEGPDPKAVPAPRALALGGGRAFVPAEAGFHVARKFDAGARAGPGTEAALLAVNAPVAPERDVAAAVPAVGAARPDRAGSVHAVAGAVTPAAVKGLFAAETIPESRLYWVLLLMLALAVATTDWILYFLRVLY